MVAPFRLFQPAQMGLQLLLVAPGRTVDALELRIAGVAAPIGAGEFRQPEGLGELAGGGQMRAAAQVDPAALAIHRQVFVRRQFADPFGLEAFAGLLEMGRGRVARPDFADNLFVPVDDLAHLRFDRRKIVRREVFDPMEIVIETVFGRRAERDLRARIELLHRFGQHMGGVVPDQLQCIPVLDRDDLDRRVRLDRAGQIAQGAVDPDRQSRFRKARPDRGRHRRARHRRRILPDAAVGQGDIDCAVCRIAVRRCRLGCRFDRELCLMVRHRLVLCSRPGSAVAFNRISGRNASKNPPGGCREGRLSGQFQYRTSRPSAAGRGHRRGHRRGRGRPELHGREYRSAAPPCQGRARRRRPGQFTATAACVQ